MTDVAVIYRYAPGGNGKARPGGFSKEIALASFLRAVAAARARVDVLFLVDGGAPREVLTAMQDAGRVVVGSWGSNRRSYLQQVRAVVDGQVDAELVWFAEDDYLYGDGAFDELLAASRAMPGVDYFALTAPTQVDRLECRRAQAEVAVPGLDRTATPFPAPDGPWRAIASTTSTFGVRPAALRADARIVRAAPWSGAAWDRTTLLTVQGLRPYPWRSILTDLVVPSTPTGYRRRRTVWKVAGRVGMNLLSLRPAGRRRTLAAPPRARIAHLELPWEVDAEHWEAELVRAGRLAARDRPALVGGTEVPPPRRGASTERPQSLGRTGSSVPRGPLGGVNPGPATR